MSSTVQHGSVWFVYLITNFDPTVKTNSYVGVATDPERALVMQRASAKIQSDTNSWRLELVVGPCPSQNEAEQLRDEWTAKSRGITSRRNTGKKLFVERARDWQGLRCFDVVAGV